MPLTFSRLSEVMNAFFGCSSHVELETCRRYSMVSQCFLICSLFLNGNNSDNQFGLIFNKININQLFAIDMYLCPM